MVFSILLFAFCFFVPSASAGTIIHPPSYLGLQNGLVGCWTFDGSYSKAPDCSGNNNTGTLTNGPTKTTGKVGQALSFDAGTDYVSVPHSANFNPGANPFTVSTWIKTTNNSAAQFILSHYVSSPGWGLAVTGSCAAATICFWDGNAYAGVSSGISTNVWAHVVAVRSGTTVTVYVDGVNKGNITIQTTIPDITTTLNIGTSDTTTFRPFLGSIDDVRIYNRALSASEIARLYKIGQGSKQNRAQGSDQFDKGLVGHWTFDGRDISGTRAKDRSGKVNHGTMTNGPVQILGRIGQALNFDGTNDYVNAGTSTTLHFTENQERSFGAWVKFTDATSRTGIFISKWVTNGGNSYATEYALWKYNSKFRAFRGDGATSDEAATTTTLLPNTWYHVFATHDSTGLRIYLNGKLEGSDTTLLSTTVDASGSPLVIGVEDTTPAFPWQGTLDDVRIYNRALSAGEIARMYQLAQPKVNVTQTTLDKGLVGHWTFDGRDISGTRAKDRSGLVNHGTMTSGPAQILGRIGQALSFDGVDDYVIANNSQATLSVYTSCAWVKPNFSDSNAVAQEIIVRQSVAGDSTRAVRMVWTGNINAWFSDSKAAFSYTMADSLTPFSAGSWHHLCFSFSGGSGSGQFYWDGSPKSTTQGTFLAGPNNTANLPYYIGSSVGSNYFNGSLDDVRIYNRALSAGEVNKLWQMGR